MTSAGRWVRILGSVAAASLLVGCGVRLAAAPPESPTVSGAPSQPAPEPTVVDPAPSTAASGPLVRYKGPVEHIFFHPLVVYPEIAFYGSQARGFNQYFATVSEFQKMLRGLYANDWVLVDINSLVVERDTARGTVLKAAKLMLPKGKKPLVISIDDLNFYQYMIDNNLNSKLVLDQDGNIAAEYRTPKGKKVISKDSEIVPILDQFVAEHPDFSVNGAKGVIALTGFEGILGYRTSGTGATHPAKAKAEVAPVVSRLKETGWTFASHSYSHLDVAKASLGALQSDTQRWRRTVEPLVGPTQVYVFPFGASVQPGSEKFRYLQSMGFRIFDPIGPTANLVVKDGYAIQDRVHVDGISLLTQQWSLERFFDPGSVVDKARPPL